MITSPTNRIYVGSTIDIEKRICHYKNTLAKSQTKLHNSIKKYGWENHTFEIVWAGLLIEMLKYETLIGFGFNALDSYNLNCKLPKFGEEYNFVSEETRLKMSNWQIGRKMSDEAKLKMKNCKLGKKLSSEHIKKVIEKMKQPIIQLDKQDNFIREWPSAKDAAETLNIKGGHISSCCRGERKTCNGFKWKLKKIHKIMIRKFIQDNNLSFEEGSRNSSVVTIIGYAQFKGLDKLDVEHGLQDEIKADSFILDELNRLFDYCKVRNYKNYWTTPEATRIYKF